MYITAAVPPGPGGAQHNALFNKQQLTPEDGEERK